MYVIVNYTRTTIEFIYITLMVMYLYVRCMVNGVIRTTVTKEFISL